MITFCLTACGRPDLLEITLESFFKYNTYPIKEFMIYEDSGTNCNKELQQKYKQINWILGTERLGQITALDRMYSQVKTPYIFHCEDDWQFLKSGFIEESLPILELHPDILQVRLCALEKFNSHPVEYSRGFAVLKNSNNLWAGTNFNPSLKRKSDYDAISPFGNHTTFSRYKPWKSEAIIAKVYNKMGFKAALLPDYITHIGNDRHVE